MPQNQQTQQRTHTPNIPNTQHIQNVNYAPFIIADRKRTCPYCQKVHFVKHLGKDYCSKWCADTHYNEKRRLKKQLEKIGDAEPTIEDKAQIIKINIEILDALPVDPVNGTKYNLFYLAQAGFNFLVYSNKQKLHNIRETCHYLIFGCYKIFLLDYETVLITKDLKEEIKN